MTFRLLHPLLTVVNLGLVVHNIEHGRSPWLCALNAFAAGCCFFAAVDAFRRRT